MDKNQIIGFVLIFAILVGWSIMSAPSPEQLAEQKRIQDSIQLLQQQSVPENSSYPQNQHSTSTSNNQPDSAQLALVAQTYGSLGESITGEEKVHTIENDLLKVKFSSKGARIISAHLKNYDKLATIKDEDGNRHDEVSDLLLMANDKDKFEYFLPIQGKTVSTQDLYFDASQNGNSITFRTKGKNGYIQQEYTLGENYDLDYKVSFVNLQHELDRSQDYVNFRWVNNMDKIEQNVMFEQTYSTVYFKETEEDSDYCNCRSDATEELESNSIDWISNVHQFFNATLMADSEKFRGGKFETIMPKEGQNHLKTTISNIAIPYDHSDNSTFDMTLYLGPNEFNTLKSFDNGLEEVIPFGRSIFGSINRWVIRPAFDFLASFISSKGIVIIILIFILKMLLYPLYYKFLYSQAKMGALKPEITKIKDKYKEDAQKSQMETMKLYREYGVSPLGGCLPQLIQMPIWYALFRFFPASITFRQEGFLWATDLSSFDVLTYLPFNIPFFGDHISLFTILWALSTVAYTYYNTKHMDMTANPAMKYVQYLMPIMFLVFFNNYASGLTCYMFFSNLFTVGQTLITKNFIFDEDKIRAELETEKAKPKKVSKFQQILEEANAKQQKQAKSRNKRR